MRSLTRFMVCAAVLATGSCAPELEVAPTGAAVPETITQQQAISAARAALARWSDVIPLSLVPAAAANMPDGRVLFWSSEDRFSFAKDLGRTYSTVFDPVASQSTERVITETGHDMFCPGTAMLSDGSLLVNGGLSNTKTSLFNPLTGVWSSGAAMNIKRAYQGTVPLQDGSVFTLGGSWSGGFGNKDGEVWNAQHGWSRIPNVRMTPFLGSNALNYGSDSHLWLFPSGDGRILYPGPSVNMSWIDPTGDGSVSPIGRRGNDVYAVNGNAVMYDVGKVLKVGGAPLYSGGVATESAYVFDLSGDFMMRKVQSMAYKRAMSNAVVLPTGEVIVVGGMTTSQTFSDRFAVLAPELFDPDTETFTALPPMQVARNYHSVALLMLDGRVVSAGGGLCGTCTANHPDLQILSPPYLFNPDGSPATRPVIDTATTMAAHGSTLVVEADSPIASFAVVRASATTHTTNNDQRRLPLEFRETAPLQYELTIPSNAGWALPGYYMLFGMNADGVPSMGRSLRIGTTSFPTIEPVGSRSSALGAPTSLSLAVVNRAQVSVQFSAQGLPPGVVINPTTGVISGTPTTTGRYRPEVSVSDGSSTTSTTFAWTISSGGTTRYVRIEQLSEASGGSAFAASEVAVLDGDGTEIAAGGIVATADAQLGAGPAVVLDGSSATYWTTPSQPPALGSSHWLQLDLGGGYRVSGLRFVPRQDSTAGSPNLFRVLASEDGVTWTEVVAPRSMPALGLTTTSPRFVYFSNVAPGKIVTQSTTQQPAQRATDNNTDGTLANGSVAQTAAELAPWWEVDLGASQALLGVRLWNRTDCCTANLGHFYVFIAETPMAGRSVANLLADQSVLGVYVPQTLGTTELVRLDARGRYVRVALAPRSTGIELTLAEVEVYPAYSSDRPPQVQAIADQRTLVNTLVSLPVVARDPDGLALTYTASGLPPGLTIQSSTIQGSPTTPGIYNVDLRVQDASGSQAFRSFTWTVDEVTPLNLGVHAPIAVAGSTVTFAIPTPVPADATFAWSFGDGTTTAFSTEATTSHTYALPGVYTVVLTARRGTGEEVSHTFLQAISDGAPVGSAPRASSGLAWQSRPGLGDRLWVVNPDSDTVAVLNAATLATAAQVHVGDEPRTLAVAPDGTVWVTAKGAGTVSVIDATTLTVARTITLPRGSMPYGLVMDGDGSAYVALEGLGQVVKIGSDGSTLASLDVGPGIRHLSLHPSGNLLVAPRFITPPQPGESTANVFPPGSESQAGAEVLLVPTTLASSSLVKLAPSVQPDTGVSARGIPNYLGAAAIAPSGAFAWIPSKQDNILRGMLRDGQALDFQTSVRAISSRIDLTQSVENPSARVDHDNSGLASAAIYHPAGAYVFVALETSREIAVLDAARGQELTRLPVGRAPQHLTLSPDGTVLAVQNSTERTVTLINLDSLVSDGVAELNVLGSVTTVAVEPLSAQLLRGKQLFHDARDARLARDSYLSCATCHNEGGGDGRTWDFTGFGEGLRNTISLLGKAGGQGRLHWTGNFDEVQDFEAQIRNFAEGSGLMADADFNGGSRSTPLGDTKAGLSSDLDALAAYVRSFNRAAPSPFRTASGTLTAQAQTGRTTFIARCVGCHGGPNVTNSGLLALQDVGTIKPASGKRLGAPLMGMDSPSLRDAWFTAPYLHDGSAATVRDAIAAHTTLSLSSTELDDVAAFVQQLGSDETDLYPARALGAGLFVYYFKNNAFGGGSVSRTDGAYFDWGLDAPVAGVPADAFSARWAGYLYAPTTGSYRLCTNSDEQVKVKLGTAWVINDYTPHSLSSVTSAPVTLTAGLRYELQVDYVEGTGPATMQLMWQPPGSSSCEQIPSQNLYAPGTGLKGEYFANTTLSGTPVLTRTDATVNYVWTSAPNAKVPADSFSVRWTGKVLALTTGLYRFSTLSNAQIRVTVGGSVLIDNWTPHADQTDVAPAVQLEAGQLYTITVEHADDTGTATAKLLWTTPGATSAAVVPVRQLYLP